MSSRIFGVFFLGLGVFLLRPASGDLFASYRDWQFRVMPWLRRIPWSNFLYGPTMQRILRLLVGLIFTAVGVALLFGVLKLN